MSEREREKTYLKVGAAPLQCLSKYTQPQPPPTTYQPDKYLLTTPPATYQTYNMPFIGETAAAAPGNGESRTVKREWLAAQKKRANEASDLETEIDGERALAIVEAALSKAKEWNLKSDEIGLWEVKRVVLLDLGRDDDAMVAWHESTQVMARRPPVAGGANS